MATTTSTATFPSFTPALKPPPGVVSNPEHPASLARLADIAIGIAIPFVTVFWILRTYARAYLKRVWIFEDYLVTITWAGTVAYCGIMRATMSHNGGKHGWDITRTQAHEAAFWFNVAAIEYGVMIGLTKIAVLCLYRRVFSPVRWSLFDLTIVAFITVLALFYGITSFFKIFQCHPREKIWNKSVPGKCIQMAWILNISGGFNTITDYLILLLPIHAVRKLQLNRTKKVIVVLAFTFGLCAPIFATIGFVVRLEDSGNLDTSWKQPEILLWGAAELASGNLCVCFPELTPLFRKKQRKSSVGPRKPTASELEGWREPGSAKKLSHDPYMTKSMLSTTVSTISKSRQSHYYELEELSSNK